MRPGSAQILDKHRALITPGNTVTEENTTVRGGGYLCFWRGDLTEAEEREFFRNAIRDASYKVIRFGTDEAVKVAIHWGYFLNSRTNTYK